MLEWHHARESRVTEPALSQWLQTVNFTKR